MAVTRWSRGRVTRRLTWRAYGRGTDGRQGRAYPRLTRSRAAGQQGGRAAGQQGKHGRAYPRLERCRAAGRQGKQGCRGELTHASSAAGQQGGRAAGQAGLQGRAYPRLERRHRRRVGQLELRLGQVRSHHRGGELAGRRVLRALDLRGELGAAGGRGALGTISRRRRRRSVHHGGDSRLRRGHLWRFARRLLKAVCAAAAGVKVDAGGPRGGHAAGHAAVHTPRSPP